MDSITNLLLAALITIGTASSTLSSGETATSTPSDPTEQVTSDPPMLPPPPPPQG